MTPLRVWLGLGGLYAAFALWYTPLGGPLTPEEIARHAAQMRELGWDEARVALWREFMRSDTGGDFAMLNAIHLRDRPQPVAGVEPGETSPQVLARYTEPFQGRALRSAAHPVVMGRAAGDAMDVWGIASGERWSQGALVRYRSRRDLVEQALAVSPTGIHAFKVAAVEKTIAFPIDPWWQLGDPRLVLALVAAVAGLAWQLRCARRARA